MEEIVKHINDTNASYRAMGAGDAKNTDLFLDNEHYELFKDSGEQIIVRYNKENLIKAILFIASILPRKYDNSAIHKTISFSTTFVYDQLAFLEGFFTVDGVKVESRTQKWNARKDVLKANGEIDKRFYFNGLLEDIVYINYKGERKTAKFTIRNYFAGGYSDLHIKKGNDGIFDIWITNTQTPYDDGKDKHHEITDDSSLPLQQIYYGAPGTGKSNVIKLKTEEAEKEDRVFRITFHPDSDYSTFVGCYKPSMKSTDRIYSAEELAVKLKEIKNTGVTYPCHKFAAKYWRSLKDLSTETIKQILNACGFTESMNVEISKGVAIGQEYLNKDDDGKIIYTYTPQAFTNAYIKAWCSTEDVYLIIEEINRGNCAQIFGDLFQLLDRGNDGKSEYPIDADTDLGSYISKELGCSTRMDFPDGVKDGKKMVLPSNLYIWATMNTSDQSLFPIDSAFKRRWDWKYIPIANGNKDWKINVAGKRYDWWDFLNNINDIVEAATSSEDKKLGYYFVKADDDNNISAETFVSKVVFYLWNDVFKDYGFDWKNKEGKPVFKDEEGKDLTFKKFFYPNGLVIESTVATLLDNLLVSTEEEIEAEDPAAPTTNGAHKHLRGVTFSDGTVFDIMNTKSHFEIYLETIKKIGVEWAAPLVENMGYKRLDSPLISRVKHPELEKSRDYSYIQVGEYFFVKGGNDDTLIAVLKELNNQLSDKFTINYV